MTAKAIATCSECRKSFDLAPSDGKTTFVMADLLHQTAYACSIPCYQAWKVKNQPKPVRFESETLKSSGNRRFQARKPRIRRKPPDRNQDPLF